MLHRLLLKGPELTKTRNFLVKFRLEVAPEKRTKVCAEETLFVRCRKLGKNSLI